MLGLFEERAHERRRRTSLSRYLDGEVSPSERSEVLRHLDECQSCQRTLGELDLGRLLVARLRLVDYGAEAEPLPPVRLATNTKLSRERRPWLRATVAATALTVITVLVLYLVHPGSAEWRVESLEGSPRVGDRSASPGTALRRGELLETDGESTARLAFDRIGTIDVLPGTRVRVVSANEARQRLTLERGTISARIVAPPRALEVQTPSALAVDLGCSYTLAVDEAGASLLRVASGWVELRSGDRKSLVPAGWECPGTAWAPPRHAPNDGRLTRSQGGDRRLRFRRGWYGVDRSDRRDDDLSRRSDAVAPARSNERERSRTGLRLARHAHPTTARCDRRRACSPWTSRCSTDGVERSSTPLSACALARFRLLPA